MLDIVRCWCGCVVGVKDILLRRMIRMRLMMCVRTFIWVVIAVIVRYGMYGDAISCKDHLDRDVEWWLIHSLPKSHSDGINTYTLVVYCRPLILSGIIW